MKPTLRSFCAATGAMLALVTAPGVILMTTPAGVANADVCASVGRRVSVSGCASLADVIAPYSPAPDFYAPLPEDYYVAPPPPPPPVSVCVGGTGRRGRVSVSGCT